MLNFLLILLKTTFEKPYRYSLFKLLNVYIFLSPLKKKTKRSQKCQIYISS